MNYAKVPTPRTARTLWGGLLLAALVLPIKSGAQPTSEAGALLRRALGFYERNPKQYASEIALTQHQIGLNYWAMGDLNRAEVFIKKALARLDADDGADPRYRAAAVLDLAELHHAASHDAEAREAFVRALGEEDEIRRSTGLTNGAVFNSHSVLLRRLFSGSGSARTARSPRMATVSTGRR